MSSQRSNTSSRIRHGAVEPIFDCRSGDMQTPKDRRHFRREIGWYDYEDGEGGDYASLDVPLLHKDESEEYDIHTCFLNPVLIRVSLLFYIVQPRLTEVEALRGANPGPRWRPPAVEAG